MAKIEVDPERCKGCLLCAEFCPKKIIKASDTLKFCMERLEHQDDSGSFVTNVLHSEAVAACEAISADGFEVSLCRERDCANGGIIPA